MISTVDPQARHTRKTRAALRAAGHTQTIKPIPLSTAVPGGFTIHDLRIDRAGRHRRLPGRLPDHGHRIPPTIKVHPHETSCAAPVAAR